MLTRINRIHFFSPPRLRHYTTAIPSRIGLIKLPTLKNCREHLNGESTIIFTKDSLFYADLQQNTLLMISGSAIHPNDHIQLQNLCGNTWRTATSPEMTLIQRVLKTNDQYHSRTNSHANSDQHTRQRQDQSTSTYTYTSTPNWQEKRNTASAYGSDQRLQAETEKADFWRTMYFYEIIDDAFERPLHHTASSKPMAQEHPPSDSIEKHDYFTSSQNTDDSSVIEDVVGAVGDAVGGIVDAVSDILSDGPD